MRESEREREDVGEWSGLTTVLTTDSVYRLKTFN
jgi:hypothetical protein